MEAKTLKNVKKGDYFIMKDVDEPKSSLVWVKGDYDRSSKTYICYKFDDICHFHSFKPTKKVYTEFYF